MTHKQVLKDLSTKISVNSNGVVLKLSHLNSKITEKHQMINNILNDVFINSEAFTENVSLFGEKNINFEKINNSTIKFNKLISSYNDIDTHDFKSIDYFIAFLSDEITSALNPLLLDSSNSDEFSNLLKETLNAFAKLILKEKEISEYKSGGSNYFEQINDLAQNTLLMVDMFIIVPQGIESFIIDLINKITLCIYKFSLDNEIDFFLDQKGDNVCDLNNGHHENGVLNEKEFFIFKSISDQDIIKLSQNSTGIFFNKEEDIHVKVDELKRAIISIIDKLKIQYAQNPDVLSELSEIQRHINEWLTLPDDFRPNNWVEIIHIIIKNIQHSLLTSLTNIGPVQHMILPLIDKLEYILSTVDNDEFKLLITPKEAPEMHRITLPDLLPPEPKEKIKEDDPDQAKQLGVKGLPSSDVHHHTDRVINESADSGDTPPEKLTWSKVIDYLCFDKEHGAIKHMEPKLRDVIHDLYYRDWLSYRLEHLEDEVMSIFTIEKYQPIWEDIKAKLLDENGVNLGEFLTYLVEKVVALVNDLITFVKDTIQYIIDEIFNLVKAIIQFFELVDLPEGARDFIKTIPLFNGIPEGVTILHVIAAIPYTLYKEFISFEVPQSAAV